jgi:hypothetical protein
MGRKGTLQTAYRVCAVCQRRHAPTYGYGLVLSKIGISGDKAAVSCVRKALDAAARKGMIERRWRAFEASRLWGAVSGCLSV